MVRRDRARIWQVQAFRIGVRNRRDIWKYGLTNAVPPQHPPVRQIRKSLGNRVVTQFASGWGKRLPAQKRAASTKPATINAWWFCSGRSVPCFPGRNGHLYGQTESLPETEAI